jgi:deoxyribodipyrimidine photo-lyase
MVDANKKSKSKKSKSKKKTLSTSVSKIKQFDTSIFIFHRSIRLDDNIGLITALKLSKHVIPIFIFTPEQITSNNKFRSIPAIRFMIDGLIDLDKQLKKYGSKLFIFYDKQYKVVDNILNQFIKSKTQINALFVNMDYTPYAIQREDNLADMCDSYGIEMYSLEDYLLQPVDSVSTGAGSFYSKYTPYYKKAVKQKVQKPIKNNYKNYISSRIKLNNEIDMKYILKKIGFKGNISDIAIPEFEASRKEGLNRIKSIKTFKLYDKNRNNLNLNTTRLSAYIKFGIVSPREVYHKIKSLFGVNHKLIGQLFWREFYYNISYNKPEVLKGKSFKIHYDKIKWKTNKKLLDKWKTGTTGIPIVDAGMRELSNSFFMHNRSRLITSYYLVKHYFIDWREGEKHYSKYLIDYDPSVNNGNWQFASGSGSDSQPYFRMMNPWTQAEKHDPDCEYIKKWIPELVNVPSEDIHDWGNQYNNYPDIDYPSPYVEYDFHKLVKYSKKLYKSAFK